MLWKQRSAILLVAVTLLTGGVAAAETTLPPVLTLPAALQAFREHGFDLLIADAAVRGAQGDVAAAGAVQNPSLALSVGKSFTYNTVEAGPGASPYAWSIGVGDSGALIDTLFTGKRRLRVDVAKAALEAARLSRADAERALGLAVKQQFVQALAAKEALAVAQQVQQNADQTADLVRVRFKVGAVSEADVARAQTAVFEAAQAVDQASQSLDQAKAGLAFLIGVRDGNLNFDVETGLLQQPVPVLKEATPDSLRQEAREHRPDLLAGRREIERATAALTLSRRDRIPEIELQANYMQQGIGNTALQPPTLTFGVSAPIPVFYRNQGEIARAEADLQAQQVTVSKLEGQVAADVNAGWAVYLSARARVLRLQNGMMEQAARARDLTKIQYEKGAASLLELLDAQRSFVAVSGERIQALSELWNAVFLLEAAVGTELRS